MDVPQKTTGCHGLVQKFASQGERITVKTNIHVLLQKNMKIPRLDIRLNMVFHQKTH